MDHKDLRELVFIHGTYFVGPCSQNTRILYDDEFNVLTDIPILMTDEHIGWFTRVYDRETKANYNRGLKDGRKKLESEIRSVVDLFLPRREGD